MVSPALFLGGAALSGGLQAFGANAANKAQSANIAQILKAYKALLGEQSLAGKQALAAQNAGLGAIQGGFAGALAETNRLGDASEVAIRDQAQVLSGQAEQSLIDRGQFNPEHLGYMRRGISSDLMRLIGENNSRTASARAGLLTGGGLAQAGQHGAIANQISSNFGQRANLTSEMLGFQGSQQPYTQDYSNELGWLFAGLSKMGGGGGGGGSGLSYFKGQPQSAFSPNKFQTMPFGLK